ncbi:hypothetical protein B0H63DRAFT_565104 [Podospora didyma]|uniref:Uncharacterized protein n=1 Tax=Podospora didyma TaxID=330526 RepID=A0AAE0K1L4_9PEZI|nr:hypothetical protein B0H63DRAFT_565104 [Podospora didyma]
MRVAVLLISFFIAMVAAAPERTMEDRIMRRECHCDESHCWDGPECCASGTC